MSLYSNATLGVNLFNLSETDQTKNRADLKKALDSYFTSLDHLTNVGERQQRSGSRLD